MVFSDDRRRAIIPAVLAAVLCASLPAAAQYVATTTNGVPYPALTSATPITLISTAGTPSDRGRATVQLGFSFPYYNKVYTQLTVTANGLLFFEPSSAANIGADFFGNFAMPNIAEPNGTLAPMWDDLDGKNPASELRKQPITGANGQGIAIEFNDWSYHFGTYSLTFQVRLWQNGIVEFFYGTMIGSGGTPSATVGIEDPLGSVAVAGKPCGSSGPAQPAGAACSLADFQSNQLITFGPAAGADLSVTRLLVNGIVPVGPDLQVSTTLLMRNFGSLPANNFTYRLYLSQDTIFQAGTDLPILPAPSGPFSIPALGSLADTMTGTVPRPPTGSYYVLAVVDDGDVVAESNELNNTAINGVPLVSGVDLVAESINGPPLGGPGDLVTVNVAFSNQGIDPAGNVPFKILLSEDNVLNPTDFVIYQAQVAISGGQNFNQPITFALPGTVPAGDYYFILQIDDGPAAGVIAELSSANNVKINSTQFTVKQADLIIEAVELRDPLPPYLATHVAFFGENVRLQATIKNIGGATAPLASVVFYLSDNETLNGITDPYIGDLGGLTIASGQSQTVSITAPVPTRAVDMTPLLPGQYYFFAAAVGQNLTEVTTANNFAKTEPTKVKDPSPDLAANFIRGPTRVGAGEAFVLTRSLTNLGNRAAPGAKYRYYLSANTIVTTDDVLLKIRSSSGLIDEGTVTLDVAGVDVLSEVVEVPQGTPAATYYLGVLLDPEGQVDEVDEDNNGLAGQTVDVVAQALHVSTSLLPDGLIGLSYLMQLTASGTAGTATWSLHPGSMLPAGLSMTPEGVISGTPTTEGAWPLTFSVASGGATADALLVLRVVQVTASVAVSTVALPPPARNVPYQAGLGAVGGRAPYSWSVDSGALPLGLRLSPDGSLTGTPEGALGASTTAVLRVRDAVGNTDLKSFTLVVIDASALLISQADLPAATVGSDYAVDIQAQYASGAPLAKPLRWGIALGSLPPGLTLMNADDRVLIVGTPLSAGIFSFTLEVNDARGRSDTADFLMQVYSPAVQVKGTVPDQALRGTVISEQFTASGTVPDGVKWVVRDGTLPPGLALDETGHLQGTITADADFGRYSFTLGPAINGRVITFASYSIEVVEVLRAEPTKCGCQQSAGSALLTWGLALVAMASFRRRRPARQVAAQAAV